MEAHETSEMIEETEAKSGKNRTALTISILAMALAIASLGGSNAAKEITQEMPTVAKEAMQKKIEDYKKTIERYESEPETKEGKKELLVVAKEHEAVRNHAMRQDPWFDYAEGALQIAIVLLSVAIVAGLPALFWAGAALGAVGSLCAANGFFLFF